MGLDGIFACAIKGLDSQVLLDPFEEEFDVPAGSVQLGDGEGGKSEVVGEEDQGFPGFFVAEPNAPHGFGVVFGAVDACEDDGLIAAQAR